MLEAAYLIAEFGIIVVILTIFVWLTLRMRKTDEDTKEHNRRLIERHQEAGSERDKKLMQMILSLSGTHTRREEKENTRVNLLVNNLLQKLVLDTNGTRAVYVGFHNGGVGAHGRGLQKMSILHETVSKNTEPVMHEFQNLPRTFLPGVMERIEKGGKYFVSDLEALRDSDPAMYYHCKQRAVKSFMLQSVQDNERGVLGFVLLEFKYGIEINADYGLQRRVKETALKIGAVLAVSKNA